jgi:hypothetical protein
MLNIFLTLLTFLIFTLVVLSMHMSVRRGQPVKEIWPMQLLFAGYLFYTGCIIILDVPISVWFKSLGYLLFFIAGSTVLYEMARPFFVRHALISE